MSLIEEIWAREILDSRGNPTVGSGSYFGIRAFRDARQFRRERQRAKMKRSNCATAIIRAIWAKAF